jgi:hypothetical protein
MAETVAKYLDMERIPDLRIACYGYDDTDVLPPAGSMEPSDYLNANPSIQEQNKAEPVWYRSVIESAYCIENGRDDYCDIFTPIDLMFDPKFAIYKTVNELSLRHHYRDMGSDKRAELLKRLNESNPKLEMRELPKIGRPKGENIKSEPDRKNKNKRHSR